MGSGGGAGLNSTFMPYSRTFIEVLLIKVYERGGVQGVIKIKVTGVITKIGSGFN